MSIEMEDFKFFKETFIRQGEDGEYGYPSRRIAEFVFEQYRKWHPNAVLVYVEQLDNGLWVYCQNVWD